MKASRKLSIALIAGLCLFGEFAQATPGIFERTNLVAWCIVPFDARKRGPEERAQMLERLGIKRLAYDWRAEHIPTFDAEIETCQRHSIELTAWWFPGSLDNDAKTILAVLERHKVKTQLWVTGGGGTAKDDAEQRKRVETDAARIRPIAEAAAKIACTVALYNHGGWFGEPENQIAIIHELRSAGMTNVGIVYNLHHGHDHIERFAELFRKMQPYLMAVNLNGMIRDGDKRGHKILTLGAGDRELAMMKVVRDSSWRGPVGIIDHRPETDSEETLRENLRGLHWLLKELEKPGSGGQRPFAVPASERRKEAATSKDNNLQASARPRDSKDFAQTVPDYWAVESAEERAKLPLYQEIPAARIEELTPASATPKIEAFRTWHRSHGNPGSTRYSALDQVTRANVQQLRVAWTYHSNDGVGNIQCNPIIVNGVMFAPTAGRQVVAVNAETGAELWRFKPEFPKNLRLEDLPARRGLDYWPGNPSYRERILLSCGDWIYALDPKTGYPVKEFGAQGRVPLITGGTVAGAVFREVFVVPGYNGDVFGFHIGTGQSLWRFRTVPQPGEFGHETWNRAEQGANCWGGMALDEERGIAFIATGSPKPNFSGVGHHGDNLFSNCVLALDALTGKRLWHFQEIRHDIWDLDLPAPPNLVTVTREGRRVDAVAAVTKFGNTLLLDRLTGKPLFPFRLRRAPTSKLVGEVTAAYQPDLELPEPFARQVFTREDVTARTPEAREHILKRIAGANFGWFEPFGEGKPTVLYGFHGGAEWTGSAFDPSTGFLYVSANEIPWIVTVFRNDEPPRDPKQSPTRGEAVYQQACATCHGADRIGAGVAPPLVGLRHRSKEEDVRELLKTGRNLMPVGPEMSETDEKALMDFLFLRDRPGSLVERPRGERPLYTHNGYPKLLDQENFPGCKPPWGTLNCIDLNTGKLRWKVPLGEHPELTGQGVPKTGTENFGGATVTAGGLVFCAGTRDEMIRAFDKETGEELWRHKLPFGGFAPPAIYEANGRQFIVIAATGGGKLGTKMGDAYVAFSLSR